MGLPLKNSAIPAKPSIGFQCGRKNTPIRVTPLTTSALSPDGHIQLTDSPTKSGHPVLLHLDRAATPFLSAKIQDLINSQHVDWLSARLLPSPRIPPNQTEKELLAGISHKIATIQSTFAVPILLACSWPKTRIEIDRLRTILSKSDCRLRLDLVPEEFNSSEVDLSEFPVRLIDEIHLDVPASAEPGGGYIPAATLGLYRMLCRRFQPKATSLHYDNAPQLALLRKDIKHLVDILVDTAVLLPPEIHSAEGYSARTR